MSTTRGETVQYYKWADYSSEDISFMALEFGVNKIFPKEYKLPILLALSKYPELKNVRIEFKEKKIHATMVARPDPLSLLRAHRNRKYKIYFNNKRNKKGLVLKGFSLNAMVGVIGHELAHILYYVNTNSISIIQDGVNYSQSKFRRSFERATDYRTIEHGLGWQLYEFSQVAISLRSVSSKYLEKKMSFYLIPEEILWDI